jgi:hypothetical protein
MFLLERRIYVCLRALSISSSLSVYISGVPHRNKRERVKKNNRTCTHCTPPISVCGGFESQARDSSTQMNHMYHSPPLFSTVYVRRHPMPFIMDVSRDRSNRIYYIIVRSCCVDLTRLHHRPRPVRLCTPITVRVVRARHFFRTLTFFFKFGL